MDLSRPTIAYSVVIPAHNEAENLPRLLFELETVLETLGKPYEVIVIDDGSTDGTSELLDAWQALDERLRSVRFDQNYGQSAAFDAGFRMARGDIIITLDADGQNPPAEIPRLLAALGDADLVCGWRRNRQDHWTKRLASKFANTLRRRVLRDGIHDTGCSLKAFRRQAVQRIKLFHGMHRFLPALVQMEGFSVTEVSVAHAPRVRGRSHYGIFNRLAGPLLDLLVVYWMSRRCRRWRAVDADCLPRHHLPREAAAMGQIAKNSHHCPRDGTDIALQATTA
jgi:glycosyltransferase involved in cell wall biosynthesis